MSELRQPWWFSECEVIEKYVAPFAKDDARPKCVVLHVPSGFFLRHSSGPQQGHFWDCYGDNYLDERLARLAISQAPPPPKAGPPVGREKERELEQTIVRLRYEKADLKAQVARNDERHTRVVEWMKSIAQALGPYSDWKTWEMGE